MDGMEEIVREFLIESNEGLDQLDRDLVALEKAPEEANLLGSIFRAIHTVKGTSGVLGFAKIEAVSHVGENLLSRMRDGKLRLDPVITSGLLAMVDALRDLLANIAATGDEGPRNVEDVVRVLAGLLERDPAAGEASGAVAAAPTDLAKPKVAKKRSRKKTSTAEPVAPEEPGMSAAAEAPSWKPGAPAWEVGDARAAALSSNNIRVDVALLDKMMNLVGELVLARNQILQFTGSQHDGAFVSAAQRLNLITTELQESVMKTRMQPIGNIWNKLPRLVRDLALSCGKRVRVEMDGAETELDKTIIEAIKDPLTHIVRNAVDHGIEMPAERRAHDKEEEGRLLLRAYHEGGQVNIEISDDGKGIDLAAVREKARQKNLASPDHVQRMSERELLNLIFLPGFSTAREVTNISGRGVGMDVVKTNIEKIGGTVDLQSQDGKGTTLKIKIPLTLAIIPALVATSGGERFAIPQVSLLELVRLEGDAVERGIEYIHGAPVYRLRGNLLPLVYLNRELGLSQGSAHGSIGRSAVSFDFELVRERHLEWGRRLRKMLAGKLRITAEEAGSHETCALGHWLYGHAMQEFHGNPEIGRLEALHRSFHAQVKDIVTGFEKREPQAEEQAMTEVTRLSQELVGLLESLGKSAAQSHEINIVVLQADDRQFGVVVDEINDTEEIVVKPLSKLLKGLSCFAGATIMGDGTVALILDVMGLAQQASVVTELRDHSVQQIHNKIEEMRANAAAWLLVRIGEEGRLAIPLGSVDRLEEFAVGDVERSGGGEVVQYRNKILPLVPLAQMLNLPRSGQSAVLPVVVSSKGGQSVGLVVDKIEDVTEQQVACDGKGEQMYLQGSAVLQQRVTDLLDVDAVMASVCAEAIHA